MTEYMVPAIMGICLCVGYVVKHWIRDADNRVIPTLCAALGDLAGALLFPTGAFFPGFTATAALTGLIYGLFLYKSRPGLRQCFFAALTNGLVVTLILNTAMISWVFGPDFWPLLYTRLAEFGAMLLIQTLVMTAISRSDTLYGKLMQLRT